MTKLFLGLVLAHIDVYWHGFDFLPDVLGYLIVLLGARELTGAAPRFRLVAGWAAVTAVLSALLTGASLSGLLPGSGWPGAAVHLADCALTAVLELVFLSAVRQIERRHQTELNDAMFLPAWALTALFASAGAALRVVENDIFAILTTGTTGLLTLWLFYALWQIRKNYRYLQMQQRFDARRV